MTKNIIWLKNEINMKINEYSQFEYSYAFGFASGLRTTLSLNERLDGVDNDVKLRKRMDTLQHQIDELQKEILALSERGGLNEIKQKAKEQTEDYLNT